MNTKLNHILTLAAIFFVVSLATSYVLQVLVRHEPWYFSGTFTTMVFSSILFVVVFSIVKSWKIHR